MIAARTAASPAVLIVSLALVLLPIGLGAQALEPGARVRLTQSSGARHQGILQAIEPDSARLTGTRGQSVAVSLASVERVEVSRGRQRQYEVRDLLVALHAAIGTRPRHVQSAFPAAVQSGQ